MNMADSMRESDAEEQAECVLQSEIFREHGCEPDWTNGTPYCDTSGCQKWSGTRCRVLGHAPIVCDFAVKSMYARLVKLMAKREG